jgi:hypothetical protein
MFNEFRQLYPQGSIISELLQIDRDRYIVKVSIKVNDIILTTGLAAADTIEAAEDAARYRALTTLNLTKEIDRPSSPLKVLEPTEIKNQEQLSLWQGSPPSRSVLQEHQLSKPIKPPPELIRENSSPKSTNEETMNLDIGEIIARTDVELERLGWTKEKSRDFLVQTYGKRSRHFLSDRELIDFLQYLEHQT